MTNDYLHLQIHQSRIAEQLATADSARHARELPRPDRPELLRRLADLLLRHRPRLRPAHHATMNA